MKMKKLTILMIAVVAIGIFALPTTLSVGAGQHKFLQAGTVSGGQTDLVVFCAQCHSTDTLKSSEIDQSDKNLYYNQTDTSRIHSSLFAPGAGGCASCHAIDGGYAQTVGGVRDPTNKVQHAAALPSCLKCHTSGTNRTLMTKDVMLELNAPTEAHKNFKTSADDDIQCIGCHTAVTKSGAVSYSYGPGQNFNGLQIGNLP
jgi:cytochrome c553